jgi:inosine-uridine nucleoside N-ribohydrolase
MDPTHVVLDCDTANEVDDQFAIAHTLGVQEGTLDVRGVISMHNTTARGPTSRDMYQEEAERVVALCASDVPCIPGAPDGEHGGAGAERWPQLPGGRSA